MDNPAGPPGRSYVLVGVIPIVVAVLAWIGGAGVAAWGLLICVIAALVARVVATPPHPRALVVRGLPVDIGVLSVFALGLAVVLLSGTPGL